MHVLLFSLKCHEAKKLAVGENESVLANKSWEKRRNLRFELMNIPHSEFSHLYALLFLAKKYKIESAATEVNVNGTLKTP